VGAAIEDSAGRIHTGCNVENATYGLTVCAERVAVFKAISEGARQFRRVAVAADTDTLTPPCGACRQILWEFCGDVERAGEPARQNRNLSPERSLPEALRCFVSVASSFRLALSPNQADWIWSARYVITEDAGAA
jgi:cytidine deaminase